MAALHDWKTTHSLSGRQSEVSGRAVKSSTMRITDHTTLDIPHDNVPIEKSPCLFQSRLKASRVLAR
jgi:hypothetical protein